MAKRTKAKSSAQPTKASQERAVREMGGRVTTVEEFLGESPEEAAYIEMSLRLSHAMRAARERQGISQKELASRMGTKQPNIARLELGGGATGVGSILRALLALGAPPEQIGGVLGGKVAPDDVLSKRRRK